MKLILIVILISWAIKIAKDVLFWVYLWQIKEYRLDRMRAHFELKSAKELLLSRTNLFKAGLLIFSTLTFVGIFSFFFQIAVSIFYVALGSRSAHSLGSGKAKKPVFTKKAAMLSAVSFFSVVATGVTIYFAADYLAFLIFILLFDILAPGVVAGIVAILKFPSEIMKRKKIEQAGDRRDKFKDLLVVGISGSYGKTSMKEYAAHILSGKLRVLKTPLNKNTEMGVAETTLNDLNENYDIYIVEMGAYKKGEIKRICDMVKPQIGILTGLNEQHISLFGSFKNIMEAKYELIESLPKHGLALFNGENDYTRQLYEKTHGVPKRMYALRSFSVSNAPDITCEKIDFTKFGMEFYVKFGETKEFLKTPIIGRHNALNIAGAFLLAKELGMEADEIKKRIETLKAPEQATNISQGLKGAAIIDDTYSANPAGVYAALDVIDSIKANKKILIMQPLVELGKYAGDIHRRLALKINKVCDVCILTNNDFEREIKRNSPNTDVVVIQEPARVIERITKILKEDDVVLLENRISQEIISALKTQ